MAKRGFDTSKFKIDPKMQHQGSTGGANQTIDYTAGARNSHSGFYKMVKAVVDKGYK